LLLRKKRVQKKPSFEIATQSITAVPIVTFTVARMSLSAAVHALEYKADRTEEEPK